MSPDLGLHRTEQNRAAARGFKRKGARGSPGTAPAIGRRASRGSSENYSLKRKRDLQRPPERRDLPFLLLALPLLLKLFGFLLCFLGGLTPSAAPTGRCWQPRPRKDRTRGWHAMPGSGGSASCCRPVLQLHRSGPIRARGLFIPGHISASSNLCALLNTHSTKSLFPNSFFPRTPMPQRASHSPPYHLQAIRRAAFFCASNAFATLLIPRQESEILPPIWLIINDDELHQAFRQSTMQPRQHRLCNTALGC